MKTARFESLLEAVPEALVGMDQKGRIRFVNRETESLFGYDREQLIGEPIDTLVADPLWRIYAQHQDDYFADPRTRSMGLDLELEGRPRGGTEIPINVSMSSIDTGDVLLVITAAREVAQQKEAVKNAQLIRSIVQSSDDAIVGATLGGIITSWNPAAARMFGYSSREMVGASGRVLSPEGRSDEMDAALAEIEAGQPVEHLETTRVRKDGTVVPVSRTVAPIRDEDCEIVGVSLVFRDVTEQRAAFESAQQMAAIVEDSQDAIIGTTLAGTITSWNPAAERLYGHSRGEVVGESIDLLSPRDQASEIKAILVKVEAGDHINHLATNRIRKDGTVVPVSLTVSPIRGRDGTVQGSSTIAVDMTELRQSLAVAGCLPSAVEDSAETSISGSPDGARSA